MKICLAVSEIALLETLWAKRDFTNRLAGHCQVAIRNGERCPAVARSSVEPASRQHSLGDRFDIKARNAGVGEASAHAPMCPGHVIAIGQPLLPVAPLIGAGVKQ